MSDRCETPHESQLHLQPHPRHAQQPPCISDHASKLHLHQVVKGSKEGLICLNMLSPMLQECVVMHGPYLIVVEDTMYHGFTYNQNQDILRYHTVFFYEYSTKTVAVVKWSREDGASLDMLSHSCGNIEWCMDHVWQVWNMSFFYW